MILIDRDLSVYKLTKDFNYFDKNGECKILPHLNPDDTRYSMRPKLDTSVISKMQEKENLIFYDAILDDHSDSLEFDI